MMFKAEEFSRRYHPEMHFKMRSEDEPPVVFEDVLARHCNAKVLKLVTAFDIAKSALATACPKENEHNCWITETLEKIETVLRE